jgi:hypothetical protein
VPDEPAVPAAPASRITVDTTVVAIVSYPMAHNRIPVLGPVRVRCEGPAVAGALMTVTLQDADSVLGTGAALLDLPDHGVTVVATPPSPLDPTAMARVGDQRPGWVRVSIAAAGKTLAEESYPVTILAARQWVARPPMLALEMLAAFVIPQHPATAGLLRRARDGLGQQPNGGAMPGYQGGPAGADRLAAALLRALGDSRIRRTQQPSDWAAEGQAIRTPDEVLGGRIGSSLDICLLYAAALEQAGLNPLVWLVPEGAVVGYWREQRSLQASATTEPDELINLVDLDLIRLVDPALVAVDLDQPGAVEPASAVDDESAVGGGRAVSMAEATAAADAAVRAALPSLAGEASLAGGPDLASDPDLAGGPHATVPIAGVVDIGAARRDDILPLPAVVVQADGTTTVIRYQPPVAEQAPTTLASPTVIAPGKAAHPSDRTPSKPPARIAAWKNSLLDLSMRNRLLNYSPRSGIHLEAPPGMLAALEDIVMDGGTITLLPADQVGDVQAQRGIRLGRDLTEGQRADLISNRRSVYCDVPSEAYDLRMRRLVYRVRTIAEETGANNLYLALGSLMWTLPDDDQILRSPLVLVPVRVTTRARHGVYRIELDEAGTSTPNYCLLEKLRQVHGLSVPGLEEPAVDSSGIDLDAAFRALRTALAEAGLPYRVEQTADLAILAFAKFRLWKDLDDAWDEFTRSPLVRHLAMTPTDTFGDPVTTTGRPDLDELATACPVPADASQLDAVAAAVAGHTFVLEGPPGTGKSQTITNVLARAMASGKRVLFVAEKRAALDVVTRRLDAVGLHPFCLDLHDKGARPATVRATVRAALDAQVQGDDQGLAAATERMRSSAGQLGRYAARLHEANGAGLSYYSAHTQALAVGEAPGLPVPPEVVASGQGLAGARSCVATLPDAADPARPRVEHPWGFVDPPEPAGADPDAIIAAADEVTAELTGWWSGTPVAGPIQAAVRPADLSALAMFAGTWAQDLTLIDEAATRRWQAAADDARTRVDAFLAISHPGLDQVRPEALGLPIDDIDREARVASGSSWFGRKRRQLAVVARLDGVIRDGVTIPRKQIADLTGALAGVSRSLAALATEVSAVSGLATPPGWNPLLAPDRAWLDDRISWLTWAGATASLRDPAGRLIPTPEPFRVALRDLLESRAVITDTERESTDRLATAVARLAVLTGGDQPFAAWAPDGLVDVWLRTAGERAADPGMVRRYLGLLDHLQPLRFAGLTEARRTLLVGAIPAAEAARALEAGIAASSSRERADATGLAGFDRVAQTTSVTSFVASAAQVRGQLTTAIPAGLVDARSFDAASGYGRIGELTRELGRQRGGLTIRGLMSRYGDLVTRIMPCTLVSPDSLARFFPPRHGLFDLVVFDEASQIRVADAVGALGRAGAAVVVGDSQQMPPTSFAESTWVGPAGPAGSAGFADRSPDSDDDPEDLGPAAVDDEESILTECVQSGLTRRWLSWHYRSQDETLIAFSNRRYYEDRLSSFPSPVSAVADPSIDGHGVNLVRVDGRFLRSGSGKSLRTNPIEAVAVVTEIRRRFAACPDSTPSIGVVTFNAPQRTHIEALLRDLHDDRVTEALDRTDGEGLFVKNLENVQGDERDVILFSTAFSANARGVLPLNFGPLNQVGGERRLNVAITRARRQVIVFSSFDPEDLRAEETSSQGIKDLRAYLELARSGTGDSLGASPRSPAADRHRDEIAAALRDRGLAVDTTVGLSEFTLDLAIGVPGSAGAGRVAVLLDGPAWAARRTVGDRDGLPVDVLSRLMGWSRVERIWLPEWLRDRKGVLDRLQAAAVDASTGGAPGAAPEGPGQADPGTAAPAVAAPGQTEAPGQTDPGTVAVDRPAAPEGAAAPALFALDHDDESGVDLSTGSIESAASGPPGSETLTGETAFVPWRSGYLGGRDVLDALPRPAAAQRVARALAAGIQAEGPIHRDRLARLVAGGFDLGRLTADRRAAILACLPPPAPDSDGDPFLWPAAADPATWTGFRRTGPNDDRPLDHVSPDEIGNAMAALCVAGAGVDRDQLYQQTLLIFGFRRRTPAQLVLLEAALTRAVGAGRLHIDGSLVAAAPA